MQPLEKPSNAELIESECTAELLSTVPLVMRTIRSEMRSRRPAGLSVPQFRALSFIYRHEGVSLSEVAEHLGLTLPTVSRLTDALVKREFVAREVSAADRRRATLRLTEKGVSTLVDAAQHTRIRLAELLKPLSQEEQAEIAGAMRLLNRIFSSQGEAR
jgi:DNA-binding MarR family transcriptional regulator